MTAPHGQSWTDHGGLQLGTFTLFRLVERSAAAAPDSTAVEIRSICWEYEELVAEARRLAALVTDLDPNGQAVAVMTSRTGLHSYAAVIAPHAAARTLVPLSVANPVGRNADLIRGTGTTVVLTDTDHVDMAEAAVGASGLAAWVVPLNGIASPRSVDGAHTVVDLGCGAGGDQVAYVMATSGSTGVPKLVAIKVAQLAAYLTAAEDRWPLEAADRCSQEFAFSFDLSMHDLFSTWGAGACLCPPAVGPLQSPVRFIERHGLTRWFSGPFVAARLVAMGRLPPRSMPDLRTSMFCGEPLLAEVASAWAAAAPASVVDNVYGPTEATLSVTAYRYPCDGGPNERNGILSIGASFGTTRTSVRSVNGAPMMAGTPGELWLSGPQVIGSYLRCPGDEEARFAEADGARWYRTGDIVVAQDEQLLFVGRNDDQVQIRGMRAELGEIEHALRVASGQVDAVAVPWPPRQPTTAVVAVVKEPVDEVEVLNRCRMLLAQPLVPKAIVVMGLLPTNAHGKLDRAAVGRFIEERDEVFEIHRSGSRD